MTYAIYNITDGVVLREYASMPKALEVGRRRIISPVEVGDEGTINSKTYRFVQVVRVAWNTPGPYYTQGADTSSLEGNTLTVTRAWSAWSQPEIDAEIALQDNRMIDGLLEGKLGKILYALAKADPMPTLTPKQFRTYVEGL